jgi:hypothetical protein
VRVLVFQGYICGERMSEWERERVRGERVRERERERERVSERE